ncbi:1298_t:CDS:2, partial [Cetraspora pellucida]
YKDNILLKLDQLLKNSLSLITVKSSMDTTIEQVTFQKNKFGVIFSIAKIEINIALKTKSNKELVQLLKGFILAKQNVGNNNSRIENNKIQNND